MIRSWIILCFVLLFLQSCTNDDLSVSDATNMIQTCLTVSPRYRTVRLKVGKRRFYLDNKKSRLKYENLKKLAVQGLINVDSITTTQKIKYTLCNVEFTEKGKRYILKNKEKNRFKTKETVFHVKIYDYKLDNVKTVRKRKNDEGYEVLVVYKKNNHTPFYVLDKDNIDYWVEKEIFTDNGVLVNCN